METDDQRYTQPQDEGDGLIPSWSWTNDCTAHDQTTPEPRVKVPYWHLEREATRNLEEDDQGRNENSREDVERA